MVVLHRLGRAAAPLHLNADLILTVEACPDTVVTLTTGARVVVEESPAAVVEAVRDWRVGLARDAWTNVDPTGSRSAAADHPGA